MKIGIISDTHNFLPDESINHLHICDEIWHAGDIGSIKILEQLENIKRTRAVYGNIDNDIIKQDLEEFIVFQVEDIKILLIHIAGKPPHYNKKTLKLIKKYKPKILICGHSHILKIMKDDVNNILVINPGALGKIGFHKKKTMVRIDIDRSKISNVEVIEF